MRSVRQGVVLRFMIGLCGLCLLAVPAAAQDPQQILKGLSAKDREKALAAMGNGASAQNTQARTESRLTPPRKPPSQLGPIAGFEGRDALQPFGSRLMESAGDYSTILDIPVPGDYEIGPGDTIELQLFGKENRSSSLAVDRNGVINLPDIGPLPVSGMTFEAVSRVILERISKQKIGVEASVTMGPLRSIQVFLAGDVNYPGSYTTHALTSVTNALLAAGGVRPTGSLRKVELRRGGRGISQLDLYDVLLKGDIRADLRLQPGDVIFVPPVGPRIAIDTGVNRPAIYELLKESTLGEVVRLAGGLLPTAFPVGSKIERVLPDGSRKITTVNLATESGARMTVRNGDILSIPATLARVDGTVSLAGAIERPGQYEWRSGMAMTDIVTPALLKRGAWRLLAFIGRVDPLSGTISYLPFSPAEVFAGKQIISLEDQDEIYFLDAEDVEFLTSANVQFILSGQVLAEDRSNSKGAIVKITAPADGTQGGAARKDVASRVDAVDSVREEKAKAGDEKAKITETTCQGLVELASIVSHEGSVRFRSALYVIPVQAGDPQYLKSLPCPPLYQSNPKLLPEVLEHTVTIRGEVKSPGVMPAAPGVSLQVVLRAAKGITREADPASVEVLRQITLPDGRGDVKRLVLNAAQFASETLHGGDMIIVPKRYNAQDNGTVRVSGEVYKPGVFDIRRGERLSEVLARSGGLTPHAYAYGTVFQRVRIKEEKRGFYQRAGIEMQNAVLMMAAKQKRTAAGGSDAATFAAMRGLADELKKVEPSGRVVVEADPVVLQVNPELDMVLEPGDEIIVPKRPSHVVVMGEVLNPGAVQFRSGLRANDYLHAAGGVAQTGDESRTYMILPNGNAEPLKVSSWNAQPVSVPPGSVIYVPRDPLPLDNTALFQTVLEIAKDVALTAASLYSITK